MDVNELKQSLKHCTEPNCIRCMYRDDLQCVNHIMSAADSYIAELEERIAIMQESMEALEKRCKALEKQNEPMLAVDIVDNSIDGVKVGICPACEETIANIIKRPTKYCKYCGQAVKWE